MREIKMCDLQGQYNKIKSQVDTAIQNVINQTCFINGDDVKQFKSELGNYLNVKKVIPCGNGTDALQLILMSLGLQPGDEIITPNFTFVATVEVVRMLGLTPVFVDVDSGTYNIDVNKLEDAITPKTKVIIPVHLFGQCANMEVIMKIAQKYNLFVVEDNAQALGAKYTFSDGLTKMAGTIGHFGSTSFFPSKNLGCFGDGGAVFTNNDEYGDTIQHIANHGAKIRYFHDLIGVNSRLDTIQAAILRVKLQYLDEYHLARQRVASFYDKAFESLDKIAIPARNPNSTHIFHQYTIVLKGLNRKDMIEFLKSKSIPAMVYYPVPSHLQNAFKTEKYNNGDFPVTEFLCENVLSLPIHTEMDDEQLNYIAGCVHDYLKKK